MPEKLRHEVLYLAHDRLSSGHMGISKTISRIRQHFIFPGLEQAARKYVLSCTQRQKVARSNLKDRAPLVPIPFVSEPMQEWVMDFAGPFEPTSSSGKKYILILVDAATAGLSAEPGRAPGVTTPVLAGRQGGRPKCRACLPSQGGRRG